MKQAHRPYKHSSLVKTGKYTDSIKKPKYKKETKNEIISSLKIKNGLLRKQNDELRDKIIELTLELNYLKRLEQK